jgi:asparagine synthase (glutamine-hydrolysing)
MSTPDGRFWIVFNGEIYNYVELRHELEQKGEVFRSNSDTEVLLKLLARRGVKALESLNGMFALAFVDTQERTFLLARDRLGQKPLYYLMNSGQMRFASELKALLAWPDAERDLNLHAVVTYLTMGYLPAETSIFRGYQKLRAGSFMVGSLDEPERAKLQSYWRLEMNGETGRANLTQEDLDTLTGLLIDATRIRLRSDVPVGVFLSGGLDSGLITALAAESATNIRPLAFTIGFTENEFDESELAASVVQQSGLEHRVIMQRPSSLDGIDQLAWFYDEPFGDASALPTLALCAAASGQATVFLSGDGGDEAFSGYRRYIESQRYSWLAHAPSSMTYGMRLLSNLLPRFSALRYQLMKSGLPDAGFAAAFDGIPNDPVLRFVLSSDLDGHSATAGKAFWHCWPVDRQLHLAARQQMFDYAMYLPDDILVKMDRASMAHSIEVRSPFLDYRLVEWAAKLPRSVLLNGKTGKLPLRKLGETWIPQQVQSGAKRGFAVPLDAWFRQPEGNAFLRMRLLSSEAKQRNLWDLDNVESLISRHQANQGRQFGQWLWRLLVFDAWARLYFDSSRFLDGPLREKRYA